MGELALSAVVSAAGLLLLLPTLIVIPMSFSAAEMLVFPPPGFSLRWYANYLASPEWRGATLNSIVVALGAAVLATILGTLAALALARHRVPGAGLVRTLFLLPIIVPSIVTAVAIYRVFSQVGLASTIPGLILAHALLGLPFVVINVSAVLQKMDWRIEQAARSLGAGPRRAFITVTLPMIAPGILAGALFALLTSFDEVVVALFLSGIGAVTLPVQMWSGIRFEINPTVAAVSVLLVLVSTTVFAAFAALRRSEA
jgi:putative spermidine/putrescine transport system permease protein